MKTQRLSPDLDDPFGKPNPARIYDYLLGGYHNVEVDRAAAAQLLEIYPDISLGAQVNRAFLRRAVTFFLAQGIDQFLDIGAGIPTIGNVHEVAHQINPAAHIVYVDSDPVAVLHSQSILNDPTTVVAIQADARQPDAILAHPEVQRLLDLTKPLAVLLVALLHFVTDDEEAYRSVRALRDALAPGSYIAITHGAEETASPEAREQSEEVMRRSSNPARFRSRTQIEAFFRGFDLVEPGLVYTPLWRPERDDDVFLDQPVRSLLLAGVGRKP